MTLATLRLLRKPDDDTFHIGPPWGLVEDMASPLMQARCGIEAPWFFQLGYTPGSGFHIDNVCKACQMQGGIRL